MTCKQPVHTAEIHKGAVFSDVFDHTINRLTLGQIADDFGTLFGTAFFQDCPARDNDVATAAVHFQDLEGLLQAHQRPGVTHRTHIDLAAGQEGHGTAQIDRKAALDPTEDRALDAVLVGVGFLETVPGFLAPRFVATDRSFATGVFDPVKDRPRPRRRRRSRGLLRDLRIL